MQRATIFLFVLSLAACGGRTSPATQPSPAAFDPSASEPEALEIVDEMLASLGDGETWENLKQLCWTQVYVMDDEPQAIMKHCWDRWNGRHRFEVAQMDTVKQAEAEGKPELVRFQVAMYDLFNRASGWAGVGHQAVAAADKERFIEQAYERWKVDAYQMAMIYKLKDPGVELSYYGEVDKLGDREDLCQPTCDTIKVSFASEVGEDTYFLHVNRDSRMPEAFERPQGETRIGYAMSDWVEAGGLQWPSKMQNIGLPSEVIMRQDIDVGSPDDALYIPQVR